MQIKRNKPGTWPSILGVFWVLDLKTPILIWAKADPNPHFPGFGVSPTWLYWFSGFLTRYFLCFKGWKPRSLYEQDLTRVCKNLNKPGTRPEILGLPRFLTQNMCFQGSLPEMLRFSGFLIPKCLGFQGFLHKFLGFGVLDLKILTQTQIFVIFPHHLIFWNFNFQVTYIRYHYWDPCPPRSPTNSQCWGQVGVPFGSGPRVFVHHRTEVDPRGYPGNFEGHPTENYHRGCPVWKDFWSWSQFEVHIFMEKDEHLQTKSLW